MQPDGASSGHGASVGSAARRTWWVLLGKAAGQKLLLLHVTAGGRRLRHTACSMLVKHLEQLVPRAGPDLADEVQRVLFVVLDLQSSISAVIFCNMRI